MIKEQAHSLVKVNPRLEAALKERSLIAQLNSPDPVVPPHSSTPADKDSNKQAAPANVGLKGINQSLIDKVFQVGFGSVGLVSLETLETMTVMFSICIQN